jgi:hypothetical protein
MTELTLDERVKEAVAGMSELVEVCFPGNELSEAILLTEIYEALQASQEENAKCRLILEQIIFLHSPESSIYKDAMKALKR